MEIDPFPGISVISWFESVEAMLADVLAVIPFCKEHEEVWSPRLATVLLEACSQIDSLYKHEFGKINIERYQQNCGSLLAPRWVLFWAESTWKLHPFQRWELPTYEKRAWWGAFNAVKHDRVSNRRQATLWNAVHAVAGLLLAILRYEPVGIFIESAGWIKGDVRNPYLALLKPDTEDRPSD